jgi:hypothetical protein
MKNNVYRSLQKPYLILKKMKSTSFAIYTMALKGHAGIHVEILGENSNTNTSLLVE